MCAYLVYRAQGILLRPREEWIKIKEESLSSFQLFSSYVLILAAVSPLTRFLANLLYGGFKKPYSGWSWNLVGRNVLFSIITYIFSLVIVYLFGRIINFLAPVFSSSRNSLNSMKLAAFSMFPYWMGGVLYIVPRTGWILKILVGFYGVYILYLGFAAALMGTPREKVVKYLVICSILIIVLIAGIEIVLKALFTFWGIFRII